MVDLFDIVGDVGVEGSFESGHDGNGRWPAESGDFSIRDDEVGLGVVEAVAEDEVLLKVGRFVVERRRRFGESWIRGIY